MKSLFEQLSSGECDSELTKKMHGFFHEVMDSDNIEAKCSLFKSVTSMERNFVSVYKIKNNPRDRQLKQAELINNIYDCIIENNKLVLENQND